jgi:hypothetical protein
LSSVRGHCASSGRGRYAPTIFWIKSPSSRFTRESIGDSMADARVAAIDATVSPQDLTEFAGPPILG